MDSKHSGYSSAPTARRMFSPHERLYFMVKKDVKQLLETGRKYFNEGDIEQAIKQYRKALDVDAGCALTHFNLGYAYHEEGRYEHARESYLKAIELEPTCSLFLEHLARLNFETLDYQEAIKLFNRASLVGPIQPLSLGLWGRALYESGLYEEAIAAFENLLSREQHPAIQVGGLFWLVVANLKLDRIAQARVLAEELLKAPEIEQKILLDLGEHFLRVRCLELGRAIFERLAVEHEELVIARMRLEDIRSLEQKIYETLPNLFEGDEERVLHNCSTLRNFGSDKISRAMISLLDSSSPLIREAVLDYHTAYGFDIVEQAAPFLHDPVDFVRLKAAEYLDKLDSPKHTPLFLPLLEDEKSAIRKMAAGFLARHGTMEHLPRLEMLYPGDEDGNVRIAMREAIFKIKRRHQERVDAMANMTVVTEPEEVESPQCVWRSKPFRLVEVLVVLYLIYKILYPIFFG
ncbi:MAG TPA: tetratricopeptide repeat protein [bacterium]|nr:tetratricopeptide repeat protein [bacterium]HQL60871.1 tetratricopeptide repeat protein [bacterium]